MGNNRKRNNIFHFKQFDVADAAGAMKIGTDGVALGAWCAVNRGARVWDAGCGTGLIALMTMQRGASAAVGFEIDAAAALEARANMAASPWGEFMEVCDGDFAAAALARNDLPDLIVSNPPFFTETLQSPDRSRAVARHEGSLSYKTLLDVASAKLASGGALCVVAPAQRLAELDFMGELAGMHLRRATFLTSTEWREPKRVLLEWRRELPPSGQAERHTLAIRHSAADGGDYTADYAALTREFYLHFD